MSGVCSFSCNLTESMILEPRPLWKLLIQVSASSNNSPLSCADSFAILEYLADMRLSDEDTRPLMTAVQDHLLDCPECRNYYTIRLDELEHLHAVPTA